MISDSPTMIIPLRMNDDGVIMVSETRVTLDAVIARYHQGDTPKSLHEGFPTVPVPDVYAIIAYYLAHRDEVDAYLKRRADAAERVREEIEANATPAQRAFNEHVRALVKEKRHARGE